MPAYLIANVTVDDPEKFKEYQAQVPATIARHGGRYLVRGGTHEKVEGAWNPARIVVLEFPDMATLKGWYRSDDYAGPMALRKASARTEMVLVDGV